MLSKPIPLYILLLAAVIAACLGGLAGWRIGKGSVPRETLAEAAVSVGTEPKHEPVAVVPSLPHVTETPGEIPETAPAREFDFGTLLAELEGMDLRVVPERFVSKLSIPVLSEKNPPVLTNEVIELFALGEAEVSQLNAALGVAADTLTAYEIAGAKVTEVAENEVTIELPSAGDLADQVEVELRQNMIAALGPSDGALFFDLVEHSGGRFFNDFGRDIRRYTFSATPADGSQVDLKIESSRVDPKTGQFRERSSQSGTRDIDRSGPLGGFYGAYGKRQDHVYELLPEHMQHLFKVPERDQE